VHLGDMLRDAAAKDLEPLIDEVVRKALDDKPVLVVIDSVKMLRDFVSDHALQMALYDLTSRVAHSGAVLLLLGEYTPKEMRGGVEFSLSDGIIHLTHKPREPIDRRGLVPAENGVWAAQAACSYSRRMPPRRSRRWIARRVRRCGSAIGSGSAFSGRALAMP
jgi:hypothetical protein